mgnify:CR=1 FL=1
MKIYIDKIDITRFILVLMASLLLISCNVTKTNDDGEELSKTELNATSAAEESKRLETVSYTHLTLPTKA